MKAAEKRKGTERIAALTDMDSLLELLKELDIPYEDVRQALEEGGYVEKQTNL